MHSAYWTAVTLAGKLDPEPGEVNELEGLVARLDPAAVYDAILASRVYTLALHNLKPLSGQRNVADILARLARLQDEEDKRRDEALPETVAVLEHAAQTGAHVIKGLPLRERYANPALRHLGDIDVHVARWDLAAPFAGWLRARGWRWDTGELPWLKWTPDGHIYGQLSLVFPGNAEPVTRVDLHVGPFSVAHAGLMPLVGWEQSQVLGVDAAVPCLETTIALIAAHAVNDGILSMKDINDLHVLRTGQPEPDWISIMELAGGAGAVPALRQMLAVAALVYANGDGEAPGRPEPAYLADCAEPATARARRVARFTFRDERSRGTGTLRSALVARQARRYFSARLKPRLGGRPLGDGPLTARGRNICWRLAPEEVWAGLGGGTAPRAFPATARITQTRLGSGLHLARYGQATVIRLNEDVFTPTVWGPITADSAAMAAYLREAR